ncbi:Uncharacterised protein [Mycobacteroides abscessus subsp. abscessus]|nr:Uncharacterised protein [Mycobacteroides abscessus subsp. abscessus]
MSICSSVNRPACDRRAISACTCSEESTSTPRWFTLPPRPGFSMSTSLSGGSSIAKFAYPGLRLAGSAPNSVE